MRELLMAPLSAADVQALAAALALAVGGILLIAGGARASRDAIVQRLRQMQVPLKPAPRPRIEPLPGETLVRVRSGALGEGEGRELARRLKRFGIPEHRAATAFLLLRVFSVLTLGLGSLLLLPGLGAFAASPPLTALVSMAAAIAGWFVPAMILSRLVKRHTQNVVSSFPDALELLVICVEAGLSLEDSLSRIVNELKHTHPDLAAELSLTSADLKILPGRDQAFANLAARVDAPSIRSVVTTLSQTMRYGTPLAQALRVVANEMRNDALIAMEDRANRLPALLTLPMMLFIMPTIFLIVGGPAALKVIDSFLK